MLSKKSRMILSKNSFFKPKRLIITMFVLALSTFLLTALDSQSLVRAQTDEDLASQFAPVLHFTGDEKFYPTSVDYIISSSVIKQRNSVGDSSIVDSAPTPENLGTYTQNDLFLDNKLENLQNIASDYSSKADNLGYYTYVHVVRSGASTIIQYWLFYVFNNGPLNEHQGDIEVVQVFLDGAGNPETVLLSQHGAGENAAWADMEKVNGQPVVYVAQGSHANYFRSYQGKIGIESDIVGSDGKTIAPSELQLVILGEQGSHPASQSWLDFAGRWGYWGTEQEVALGRAGPYGPVFNQDGVRWAQPDSYLASTLSVSGTYFILAWLAANFLLLFLVYTVARGAWKGWSIFKLRRSGGLRVGSLLKGRGGVGFALGIAAILVTVAALFLPWYTINASSDAGPLAQQGGATLMTMDGVNGLKVHMFMGTGNSDTSSGYVSLFSTQMPFAIIFAAGIILLVLDVVGMKSCKSFGKKLLIGIIGTLLPIIFILLFISQLPAFLPFANGLFPGQSIPPQVENIMRTVAGSPVAGTTATQFPIVGVTTVSWGLGIGAYLFIVAVLLRLVGGLVMLTAPELKQPSAQPGYGPQQQISQGQQPYASPQNAAPPQQGAPSIKRICPQCGRVVSETVKFCPHCGKSLE